MPVYAEPSDLPDEVTNPEQLLLLASRLVTQETITGLYRVDADGHPVDAELRDLFKAATVAQVRYWLALDIDPTQGAAGVTAKRHASSKSIGSASIAYESGEAATRERVNALSALGPEAIAILGTLPRSGVIVHG